MYVKDRMKNPKTITMDTTISNALDIMQSCGFHRLPVCDGSKLIGLVTEGVIQDNTPSKATSLSIYELNYILSKTKVEDIMIKDVITCKENDLLEDAAYTMLKKHIGCLPVVSKDNELIGIITNTDIFESFIDLLGYYQDGDRFVITVTDDKAGILQDISKYFFNQNTSIYNMAVYHSADKVDIVIICSSTNSDVIYGELKAEGYEVTVSKNQHHKI